MGKLIDETGKNYGRLTVLYRSTNGKNYKMMCECECGNKVEIHITSLRSGKTNSCGCLLKEKNKRDWTKHEDRQSTEYISWQKMKSRCLNKNDKSYSFYGERGISVCERWMNDYTCFLKDMGRKPSPLHSLDRIDVNGDYTPSNCKWSNKKEQARNTRVNKRNKIGVKGVSYNEKTKKYYVGISVNGKWTSLGYFIEKSEAINTRKKAEIKYWGIPS